MDTYNLPIDMSTVVKYTLDDISNIIFNGFNHKMQPDVLDIIQKLA